MEQLWIHWNCSGDNSFSQGWIHLRARSEDQHNQVLRWNLQLHQLHWYHGWYIIPLQYKHPFKRKGLIHPEGLQYQTQPHSCDPFGRIMGLTLGWTGSVYNRRVLVQMELEAVLVGNFAFNPPNTIAHTRNSLTAQWTLVKKIQIAVSPKLSRVM